MKSTRQFQVTPFQPGTGSNDERLKRLETATGQTIDIPDIYLDQIHQRLMYQPCNIRLTDQAMDYFIDVSTKNVLTKHPLSNLPFKTTDVYPVDKVLAERINAMLTIEEIKVYLLTTENTRQNELLSVLQEKSDTEVQALLAANTSEILSAYGYDASRLPKHFFSNHPCQAPMTLPVTLDGIYNVDFHELLSAQPSSQLSPSEYVQKLAEMNLMKQRRIKEVMEEKNKYLANLNALRGDNYSSDDLMQKETKFAALCDQKLAIIHNLTINDFLDTTPAEYINPCTGLAIQSISINLALLIEIDNYIDPFNQQLRLAEKLYTIHCTGKDEIPYAQRLRSQHYPEDKLPESLLLGRIQRDQQTLEIMTHPILLDGEYYIDYSRLMQYWAPATGFLSYFWQTDRHGLNPFTGEQVKTITYDVKLKTAIDRFVLNCDYFKQSITEANIRDPLFLRKESIFNQIVCKQSFLKRAITDLVLTPEFTTPPSKRI
jgi:hypothetical protein